MPCLFPLGVVGIDMVIYNMGEWQREGWKELWGLQRQLKKEFLLVEKEQQEKIKLKREIEESIRSYHALAIETYYPHGELLKEEGFDNCYNFIKDVVLTISLNPLIGQHLVFLAEERSSLRSLILHAFYENPETNDPYAKDVTKLTHSLLAALHQPQLPQLHRARILQAWELYMQRIDHQSYFEQIAEGTIQQLIGDGGERREEEGEERRYSLSREIKNEEELMREYVEKVLGESELCPPSIKIPLRALLQSSPVRSKPALRRVWQICSYFYLKPFIAVAGKSTLPPTTKERVLHFVDQLISKWGFTARLACGELLKQGEAEEGLEGRFPTVEKICLSLLTLNEDRYNAHILNSMPNNQLEIQIRIYGAYLNLLQLHELLVLIHSHSDVFAKVSERLVARTLKIFEISPQLKILNRERPALQFVSLAELRYEESISSDYYKNYTVVYRGETHKQMLKQVLVELPSLEATRGQKQRLREVFETIVQRNRDGVGGKGLTAQLEMKVKYLVYLLGQTEPEWEVSVLKEMERELFERDQLNMKLFEDTKFSLLKVYCNLRNLKAQMKGQREAERKADLKMALIRRAEELKLDVCLTSKSSRNHSEGDESIDKYRYRISSADQILIQPTSECIHKENAFIGRHSHAHTVPKFLQIFATLPEVKHILLHPSFLHEDKTGREYSYCNESKIGQALHGFIRDLQEKLKVEGEERAMLEAVIFRYLGEALMGKGEVVISGSRDRELTDKIEQITRVESRESESPTKGDSTRKRRGSHHSNDSGSWLNRQFEKGESRIHVDQLLEMGSRYIRSLNKVATPLEKVRKLREIVQIYRIVLGRKQGKLAETLQQLLVSTLVGARLPNLISNLSYLEMFLPEEKLMSSEGKIVKQFEKVVVSLLAGEYDGSRQVAQIAARQRSRIADC